MRQRKEKPLIFVSFFNLVIVFEVVRLHVHLFM